MSHIVHQNKTYVKLINNKIANLKRIYIYIYMYVCMYIYIYMYVCICMYVYNIV
ncbi:MAG: hypothetical protein NW900_01515 [Candidatus Blochmannia sp. A2]|nr:hypothetical protein [Candidatus Blochmannia sp. A2]